jgi:anti-sigma factor RsiW
MGDDAMKMTCDAAGPLVGSYLDGELSEAQASPLRTHLLDCPVCRERAKEGRVMVRWFAALREEQQASAARVPTGFAARVARRAFAGDPGLVVPVPPIETDLDEVAALVPRRSLTPFLMAATAAAAVILFLLALALQQRNLPAGSGLRADQRPPWLQEAPQPASGPAVAPVDLEQANR